MRFFAALFLFLLLCPAPAPAAESALGNLEEDVEIPSLPAALAPGAVILMPDGSQGVIMQELPEGGFLTDLGVAITPEGLIRDGEYKGEAVALDPKLYGPGAVPPKGRLPDKAAIVRPDKAAVVKPDKTAPVKPENPLKYVPKKTQPEKTAPLKAQAPETPKKLSPEEQKRLTLAQMLPLTAINKGEKPAPQKAPEGKKEPAKAPEAKNNPKAPAKKAPEKAAAPSAKPKPGQAMRIPPEAIKSGDLSFLEGCWQGTRPEYFSKRTIKECFCFGGNGKYGKRRIFDGPKRQCIGATNAHLSSQGVLSVKSSGAACSDGEEWGAAEMVCRNSGPRTPCSWVFTDVNSNARQSYEIPFIRVESCGR